VAWKAFSAFPDASNGLCLFHSYDSHVKVIKREKLKGGEWEFVIRYTHLLMKKK